MADTFMSDFTRQAETAKSRLAAELCFVSREDAMKIVDEMTDILENNENEWSALGDMGDKLSEMLVCLNGFVSEHCEISADGTVEAQNLFTDGYGDKEANRCVINEYERYVNMLPARAELDASMDDTFIGMLEQVHTEYKSSTDYMTRLVRRLLKHNFGYRGRFGNADTTRLLILRQFLKQFGLIENSRIKSVMLLDELVKKYGVNIEKLSDDNELNKIKDDAFDVLDKPFLFLDIDKDLLENYLNNVSSILGAIRIKGTLTCVSPEICARLCRLFEEDVLSSKAKDGTAIVLSECFTVPHYSVSLNHLKGFREMSDSQELKELYSVLQVRYKRGYLLYTDFSLEDRLYTLIKCFAKHINLFDNSQPMKALYKIYGETDEYINKVEKESKEKYNVAKRFKIDKLGFVDDASAYEKQIKAMETQVLKAVSKDAYAQAVCKNAEARLGRPLCRKKSVFDTEPLYRLIVLLKDYSSQMDISGLDALLEALPAVVIPEALIKNAEKKGKLSSVVLNKSNNVIDAINKLSLAASYKNIEKLTAYVEELESRFVRNEAAYAKNVRNKVELRFNNYSKKSGASFEQNKELLLAAKSSMIFEYSYLDIADALAGAKFSSQKKTKEYLYIFAIAFDIRPVADGSPERITSISDALFSDYYTDNIINNIDSVSGLSDENHGVMLDGYGINYKNFAEITYLWSLAQENMTAKQRFEAALRIIDTCRVEGMTEAEFAAKKPDIRLNKDFSQQCRNNFDMLRELPEADFLTQLLANYPCRSDNSGIMQICDEQATAKKVIEDFSFNLIDLFYAAKCQIAIKSASSIMNVVSKELEAFICNYHYLRKNRCHTCPKGSKLRFPECDKFYESYVSKNNNSSITYTNCSDFLSEYISSSPDRKNDYFDEIIAERMGKFTDENELFAKTFYSMRQLCPESKPVLRALLKKISDRLKLMKEDALEPATCSRSTLLALCFYEAIFINAVCSEIENDNITFREFYDRFVNGEELVVEGLDVIIDENGFTFEADMLELVAENEDDAGATMTFTYTVRGANAYLAEAGYQPVSSKNIFDIFLIYTAYRDMSQSFYKSQEDRFVDFYTAEMDKFKEINGGKTKVRTKMNKK